MQLNEGLEKLGESVFESNAIENIRLPSTLKKIEAMTFAGCQNLNRVEIPNGIEYIGRKCF